MSRRTVASEDFGQLDQFADGGHRALLQHAQDQPVTFAFVHGLSPFDAAKLVRSGGKAINLAGLVIELRGASAGRHSGWIGTGGPWWRR